MRHEHEIFSDLQAAKADYTANAANLTQKQAAEKAAKVKALTTEFQEYLTKGAEPCKVCGNKPVAIHQPTFYEIGCQGCEPIPTKQGNVKPQAMGSTREEAVDNWNKGNFFAKQGPTRTPVAK